MQQQHHNQNMQRRKHMIHCIIDILDETLVIPCLWQWGQVTTIGWAIIVKSGISSWLMLAGGLLSAGGLFWGGELISGWLFILIKFYLNYLFISY